MNQRKKIFQKKFYILKSNFIFYFLFLFFIFLFFIFRKMLISDRLTIGVVFAKKGLNEEQMFQLTEKNESENFKKFLEILGEIENDE